MLPAYRRVFLRLFAEAPPDSTAEIASVLAQTLAIHGDVRLREHGPYWKMPEWLEFTVQLTPSGPVGACVDALRGAIPDDWCGDVWNRQADGQSFLHPAICWACLDSEEAPEPPPFASGEIVIIADCAQAHVENIVGVRAEVVGHSAPTSDAQWGFAVRPAESDSVICLAESDLHPADEHAPAPTGEPT